MLILWLGWLYLFLGAVLNYNIADVSIIAVILISTGISVWRGFFKEVLILLFFLTSIAISAKFGTKLGDYLTFISSQIIRDMAGYFLVFITSSIIGGFLRLLITKALKLTDIATTDRVVGFCYGLGRGLISCGIMVYFLGNSNIVETNWWQEAQTIPKIHQMNNYVLNSMPMQWKKTLHAKLGLFANEIH